MERKKRLSADAMLVRMAGLCASSEQCSADIRAKILKKGFSNEEADKMMEYLVRNRYVDDDRFAGAYARDKVRFSGWGRHKVRMGLRSKGIPEMAISRALGLIPEEDYSEALYKALIAKAKSLDMEVVADRRKLYRHLASRGFESSLIIGAIRKMIERNRQEEIDSH